MTSGRLREREASGRALPCRNASWISWRESITRTSVLQFQVSGSGSGLPISEERQIYRDGVSLLATPRSSTQVFGDGRQRTEIEFRIPTDAASGAYTLEGLVRGAGVEKSARAVFLVRH